MSQQHAQSNVVAARVFRCLGSRGEFGDDRRHGDVKVEEAALVEQHGHGRCCHDFGEGCEIKERGGCDVLCIRFESKMAEGFERDEAYFVRDGARGRGEGAGGGRIFENRESLRKGLILAPEGRGQGQGRIWIDVVQSAGAFSFKELRSQRFIAELPRAVNPFRDLGNDGMRCAMEVPWISHGNEVT